VTGKIDVRDEAGGKAERERDSGCLTAVARAPAALFESVGIR